LNKLDTFRSKSITSFQNKSMCW